MPWRLIAAASPDYDSDSYVCDDVADLDNLPKNRIGSYCYVVSTTDLYILNGELVWTIC